MQRTLSSGNLKMLGARNTYCVRRWAILTSLNGHIAKKQKVNESNPGQNPITIFTGQEKTILKFI